MTQKNPTPGDRKVFTVASGVLTVAAPPALEKLVNLTIGRLESPHTKRAYMNALMHFFAWCGPRILSWETVNAYRVHMMENGTKGPTFNLRLVAIRKLCETAFLAKDLSLDDYERIKRVQGQKKQDAKTGTWLTLEELQRLLDAPTDPRDKALIATLMGAGLRRDEICTIRVESFRRVRTVWALADLTGKGKKLRNVPIAQWCATLIQQWLAHSSLLPTHYLFPRLSRRGTITNIPMTGQNVYRIVRKYASPLGFDIAPHDLRRSFARIAEESGANLRQISLSLGHNSVTTTEIYLGRNQEFTENAPGPRIKLQSSQQPSAIIPEGEDPQ